MLHWHHGEHSSAIWITSAFFLLQDNLHGFCLSRSGIEIKTCSKIYWLPVGLLRMSICSAWLSRRSSRKLVFVWKCLAIWPEQSSPSHPGPVPRTHQEVAVSLYPLAGHSPSQGVTDWQVIVLPIIVVHRSIMAIDFLILTTSAFCHLPNFFLRLSLLSSMAQWHNTTPYHLD